ncbi:uncharacterized protein LOC106457508 [Limulus polyphemus]|uniref:Uncharacterized protein LOC106457508 n=1 Tax=Limulus polyphemus TaxID=6850 RepID=A0ABM1B0P2_LIMPO|nr:uncharacterized protein LOC106457508 [Limulus polyphemus]
MKWSQWKILVKQGLKEAVFPNVVHHFHDHKWLCERAILALKNDIVYTTNREHLSQLPGQVQKYKSVDTVPETNEAVYYPTEFLNSLEPPGVSSHNLELEIGAQIMLLRNLDPSTLCNRTRLAVKKLIPLAIEDKIMTDHAAEQDFFIPRIQIILYDLPFQFKLLQFPV